MDELLDIEARVFNREDDKDAFAILEALHKERGKREVIANGSQMLINTLQSARRECTYECKKGLGSFVGCECGAKNTNEMIGDAIEGFWKIVGGSIR